MSPCPPFLRGEKFPFPLGGFYLLGHLASFQYSILCYEIQVLRFLLFLLAMTLLAAAEERPLQSIGEVRALSREEAAKGEQVEIEGIVIFTDPKRQAIVLHDGTAGCWVGMKSKWSESLRLGSRIRVVGKTSVSGSYSANVVGADVEILGQETPPAPLKISMQALFSSRLNDQWIQIEALVVGAEETPDTLTLAVDIFGRVFKAHVPMAEKTAERFQELMQKKVKLTGVVCTVVNKNNQMTDKHFFVPSMDWIVPIESRGKKDAPPEKKIDELLLSNHSPDDAVKVTGTVTQYRKEGFYLRDETGSTSVTTLGSAVYPPGSKVVVEGYANIAPFRPILRASTVKLLEKGPPPKPVVLNTELGTQINLQNEFVTTDCELLGITSWGVNRKNFQCRANNTYFEVAWIKPRPDFQELQAGDTLRIQGIYEVITNHPAPRTESELGFRINLLGSNAVTVLKKSPWWTLDRLLMALGLAAVTILGFLVWTGLLRRRVAIQTKIISRQVERSAVKDERQRIARELHDTLEQDLTGLSMQLENALEEIGKVNEPAGRSLMLVNKMLRHCRSEAHASVSDLRNPSLLLRPLAEAMKESLEEKAEEFGVALDFIVEGDPRLLRSTTQNHLLRIAREALNNAHRHGKASRVRCLLAYTGEGVTLEVEDDGKGFDTSLPPPVGHFGLTGMRERVNKIHGWFSLTSTPGKGTKIEVSMPYTSPEALAGEPDLP